MVISYILLLPSDLLSYLHSQNTLYLFTFNIRWEPFLFLLFLGFDAENTEISLPSWTELSSCQHKYCLAFLFFTSIGHIYCIPCTVRSHLQFHWSFSWLVQGIFLNIILSPFKDFDCLVCSCTDSKYWISPLGCLSFLSCSYLKIFIVLKMYFMLFSTSALYLYFYAIQ